MSHRKPLAAALSILLASFASFPYAEAAGRSTTANVNTILNGKGAPKSSLGIDGDFYIDTRSLLLYGPKAKGKWPMPQSIQGPVGPSGSDGRNGSDGKSISNANVNTVVGPQGIQGPVGPVGPVGPQGEKGDMGATGATGVAGANGSQGATGPQGPQGPQGATGAQGPQGLTGLPGAKGETGTAGATRVSYGSLNFNDLSGGIGTGESTQILGFESGKCYLVRIQILTYQPNDSTEYFMPVGLAVNASITGVLSQSSYIISHGYSFRSGTNRYENSIEAEVLLDGISANVAYGITLLVTAGRNTSGVELMKISGNFTALEVQKVQNHA